MEQLFEGSLFAQHINVALVVSRFNECITTKLLEGAKACLYRHGLKSKQLSIAWVPGAFEIPFIAKKLAETNNYNAIICLGAIIKGDTPHFDYICNEAAKGIANVGLTTGIPTIFGVLTTNTLEQALNRAGAKEGNKGWESALAAIEMCNVTSLIETEHIVDKVATKKAGRLCQELAK